MLLTTRATARVFLGEGVCRDMEWIKTTCIYTGALFVAADKLRAWPAILRPIVHWFLPTCFYTRSVLKQAKKIIEPVLAARQQKRRQLIAQGKPTDGFNAAPEWFEQASNGGRFDYDPVAAQLFLVCTRPSLSVATNDRLTPDFPIGRGSKPLDRGSPDADHAAACSPPRVHRASLRRDQGDGAPRRIDAQRTGQDGTDGQRPEGKPADEAYRRL